MKKNLAISCILLAVVTIFSLYFYQLLSGSAVCDSRWRGVAPTSIPQQEHFGNSQELEKRSPGWPLRRPGTRTIDFNRWFFLFCWRFAGWCGILSSTNQTLENDYAKDSHCHL